MTVAAETLLESVLRLPVEERSRIAARLIQSVDEEDTLDLHPEWQAEIDRRVQSIQSGEATLVSHEQVMTTMRDKLAEQRDANRP